MSARAENEIVLFIHSTGTGPFLWASVPDDAVSGRTKILAANLGYPPGDLVPRGQRLTAADDAVEVLRQVPDDGSRVHVVAHSYGALVALHAIPALAERVASVFFYEPVAFRVLDDEAELEPDAERESKMFLENPWFLHDEERAGGAEWQETFIDYWNRPGSWSKMPEHLREFSLALGWKMFQEVRACFFTEPPPGGWQLPAPTTIARGDRTTGISRAMSTKFARGRENVTLVELAGLGHMAPLTKSGPVHEELARHLRRVEG